MKKTAIIVLMLASATAFGQSDKKRTITLKDYLEEVMTKNPEARAKKDAVIRAEMKLDEAEVPLSSNFYASYNFLDDKDEPTNPFAPSHTRSSGWRAGVKDQTIFGLGTDFFVQSNHVNLMGANPQFIPLKDYYDTKAGVNLTQSLWRNGFGSATRAQYDMMKAKSRMDAFQAKFELRNLQLRAENAYWTVVSLNQIVKLQEENVERARKLTDFMIKRVNMRLVDDVDGLQVQAAQETRELELQTSIDERAGAMRMFNTLRGLDSNEVENLDELPEGELLLKDSIDPVKRMSREDFKAIYEGAVIAEQEAKGAKSQIAPQLDLTAGISTNGLNNPQGSSPSTAWSEMGRGNNPTWQVGVTFSIPLDYSLISNMRKSYNAAATAAASQKQYAQFAEERAWNDLVQQKQESQKRFERAIKLEKTQTELVKRERARLINGRSTTLQTTTIEQNFASAQIQRVRSQLALLQVHNVLKTWGDK